MAEQWVMTKPEVEMIPAWEADPKEHLWYSKNDWNLHLEAVEEGYPNIY